MRKKRSKYLITELSEFNLQRMNSDSVQASTHVDDPSLSINAFDKNQDMIRQAMSRINSDDSTDLIRPTQIPKHISLRI